MTRRLLIAMTLSATAPTFLHAQSTELTFFAGAGATQSLSQPGIDRRAGPAVVGGVELARPSLHGLLGHLALRAESGFSSQSLDVNPDVVSGDVHTMHAAVAVRVALLGRSAAIARLMPYALAGAAWARPSTRFALSEDPSGTPGARFEQVTHENVPGTIVGAGVAWLTPRAAIRAEARWMALYTAERTTSTLPLVLTIALPLRR